MRTASRARPRLVLFDLDGTLVDSFGDIAAAAARAFGAVGKAASGELLARCRHGLPLEELYHAGFGAPPDAPAEAGRYRGFVASYREHYAATCLATTAPYPGVADGLAALSRRPERPRLAVATTKRRATALTILAGTGLLEHFDAVAGSDDLPAKPDPAVLARAAAMAGTDLAGGIMVGDTDRDVGAARAAGCVAVAVTWGGMSAGELAAHGPDHLVQTFDEIVALIEV